MIFVFNDFVEGVPRPVLLVGVHVDGLIGGYDKLHRKARNILNTIKDTLDFGQWAEIADIEYCGTEIRIKPDGIHVSQEVNMQEHHDSPGAEAEADYT